MRLAPALFLLACSDPAVPRLGAQNWDGTGGGASVGSSSATTAGPGGGGVGGGVGGQVGGAVAGSSSTATAGGMGGTGGGPAASSAAATTGTGGSVPEVICNSHACTGADGSEAISVSWEVGGIYYNCYALDPSTWGNDCPDGTPCVITFSNGTTKDGTCK